MPNKHRNDLLQCILPGKIDSKDRLEEKEHRS